ncbi:hypothetical protein WK70_00470 [Burkholderia cepacia]|nr:hypothetical protein WK70_00470 [Burkholderia cepacia]
MFVVLICGQLPLGITVLVGQVNFNDPSTFVVAGYYGMAVVANLAQAAGLRVCKGEKLFIACLTLS